jgi:hypothetical protein
MRRNATLGIDLLFASRGYAAGPTGGGRATRRRLIYRVIWSPTVAEIVEGRP